MLFQHASTFSFGEIDKSKKFKEDCWLKWG